MIPSVTNTLQNGTIIDGSKIDKNFNDIVTALSDTSKDLNVKNVGSTLLTCSKLQSRSSITIGTNLTTTSASAVTISANTIRTKRKHFEIEVLDIDTTGAVTGTLSQLELDSQIYQYALFTAGIDIQAAVNDKIDFTEDGVVELTATITAGTYISTALATEIETQLNAIGANLYACTFNSTTQKFTITCDNEITILWRTGINWVTSIGKSIGIDIVNDTTAASFVSDYPYQIEYSEYLETLTTTNYAIGSVVFINKTLASTSQYITVLNSTGNIDCGSDRVLADNSTLSLMLTGTNWKLLSYSFN